MLRPLLRFIHSKGIHLDFALLLKDLLYFNEKTRLRWAKDFYYKKEEE